MTVAAQESGRDLFLDLLETGMQVGSDPSPLLHRLRAEDPVHFVAPLGFWFVTRHDDVKRLFNDPENVDAGPRASGSTTCPRPRASMLRWVEDHEPRCRRRARGARARPPPRVGAFTPRAVRRMDAQIREVVERFAAPLRGRAGRGDRPDRRLHQPDPEHRDQPHHRRAAAATTRCASARSRRSMIRGFFPFAPPDALRASRERRSRSSPPGCASMAAERRRAPREDLISDLVRAQDADERITDDEIVMLLSVLIGAGSETTTSAGWSLIRRCSSTPPRWSACAATAR